MSPLLIYTPRKSNRLLYVLDWLFGEQLKTGYRLTHDEAEAKAASFIFSYGAALDTAVSIPDAGLLWETGVKAHTVNAGKWNELPVLYAAGDAAYTLPFDLFSAIFFLLARYEEYYSFTADKHGRYPANASVLYKNGLLERPILDEWVHKLRQLLIKDFSVALPLITFSCQPSYDIDIAWSYKNKGVARNIGGAVKDLLQGKTGERFSVLSGKTKDPYDSYDWLLRLHKQYKIKPLYFILAALERSAFDKNISPKNNEMKTLIAALNKEGTVGLHPSYFSGAQHGVFRDEKIAMERITGSAIKISRQHYIRLSLPHSYQLLQAHNITDDYSMGYSTHIGFRAGTGQSFIWYDMENEKSAALKIHPFCFMDTTARYDMTLNAADAFARLDTMAEKLKQINSRLITVFHNFSLGTDPEWKGWSDAYSAFVRKYA